ncbi:hypothetical protein Halxa_2453 [Halopiger xanaduensis SH-6]|uniref:Uncharacterized protein n=1 Tax=Halopiger xanaduensis (strain DSM 18323 / JCM 14033 / SH-6) TaxID=797210 RepID=F8DBF7_HALXS|nr:hypothetical protein Halxa_2453 [Halopiger xanaduensis SH-6]
MAIRDSMIGGETPRSIEWYFRRPQPGQAADGEESTETGHRRRAADLPQPIRLLARPYGGTG